jgi:hypothetical protein
MAGISHRRCLSSPRRNRRAVRGNGRGLCRACRRRRGGGGVLPADALDGRVGVDRVEVAGVRAGPGLVLAPGCWGDRLCGEVAPAARALPRDRRVLDNDVEAVVKLAARALHRPFLGWAAMSTKRVANYTHDTVPYS